MINQFVIRRWASILLTGLLTVISFFIGLNFFGFLYGLACMALGLFISFFIATALIRNPFTGMLEGRGLLALNIDSTGVIKPFNVAVSSPYIVGSLGRKRVTDVFDRDTVFQLTAPKKTEKNLEYTDTGIKIELTEKEYNKARFALYHYPVLIWNEQVNSILTKEFFSDKEKDAFSEHGVLYLNRKMEELTSAVRDFGRHVVELTKPASNIFKSKWTWIIIGVLVVILVVLFAPSVFNAVAPGAKEAIGTISGTQIRSPLP